MEKLFDNSKNFDNLSKRFPESKYVYGTVPFKYEKIGKVIYPHIIPIKEYLNYENKEELEEVIVVFRKLNWSIDNDLRRKSKTLDPIDFKYKFNFELYCENAIKRLLIAIIDRKNDVEKFMTEELIKDLHNKFFEGLVEYFFEFQPHQDNMGEEEQAELSRDIHKYLQYHRRKANGTAHGLEPPECPSIIIEKHLSDETGWTLDYIRSIDYRDVTALNIYSTQKNFESFASSDEARNVYVRNESGLMEEFSSIEEIKKTKKLYEVDTPEDEVIEEEIIQKTETNLEQPKQIAEPVINTGVNSFLNNLIENPEAVSNDFFEKAQKQNNINKK